MSLAEVFVEHKEGEKARKHLRVKPGGGDLFLIGSSKTANLRLHGDEVIGCHAALRYRKPHWYVCDLSPDGQTKIDGESFNERRIDKDMVVEIGRHRLRLFTRERKEDLFKKSDASGDNGLHQVVVRIKGRVASTEVLSATQSYILSIGGETRKLPPPTTGEWITTEVGSRTIQQRLVATQAIAIRDQIEIDRDLRKPLLAWALLVFIMMFTIIMWPKKEPQTAQEAPLPKKQMDMIFNAKVIKKKRTEVAKMSASKPKAGGTTEAVTAPKLRAAAPDEATAPKVSNRTAAALTSLRQSGLSALVGKIAKRANKHGIMVAASGVSPDKVGSGRAFYSVGTTTNGGGGAAAKASDTYRLGGVGTQGKAGGVGDFRAGTALTSGSVGHGDVAVVDEETMIEGGLDRDVIAEVIKRNLGQIRYCYERQLSSNKDLYGKVQVRFVISPDGAVSDPMIDNTTMKNAMVEGCILRRLAGWKFPLPKGGTMVKVSYPFLFKALD